MRENYARIQQEDTHFTFNPFHLLIITRLVTLLSSPQAALFQRKKSENGRRLGRESEGLLGREKMLNY